MLELKPRLEVLDAFHIRDIGFKPGVGEPSCLSESSGTIRKDISAGEISHSVLAEPGIRTQQGRGIKNVGITGSDIEAFDLLALVLANCLLIELVRDLKPGARRRKIEMDAVRLRNLIIKMVKDVFVIAVSVHYAKLGRIEKSSAIDAVEGKKISNLLIPLPP